MSATTGSLRRFCRHGGQLRRQAVHDRFGAAGDACFGTRTWTCFRRCWTPGFGVPGTQIRFGLDGIIGFIPGIGDLAGGLASCVIVLAAYLRGAPLVTILRMVANVGVEVVVGMVPVLGEPVRHWVASEPAQLPSAGTDAGHRAARHVEGLAVYGVDRAGAGGDGDGAVSAATVAGRRHPGRAAPALVASGDRRSGKMEDESGRSAAW